MLFSNKRGIRQILCSDVIISVVICGSDVKIVHVMCGANGKILPNFPSELLKNYNNCKIDLRNNITSKTRSSITLILVG